MHNLNGFALKSVAVKSESIPEKVDQLTYSAAAFDFKWSSVKRAAPIEVSLSFGNKIVCTEVDHRASTNWIAFLVRAMKDNLHSVEFGEPEFALIARSTADCFGPPNCR